MTVSGKLSFPQDLIFSLVTTYEKMSKTIADFNAKFEEDSTEALDFSSNFVLSRYECINSAIKVDILEVLRNVCTSKEYAEILDFPVETTIF